MVDPQHPDEPIEIVLRPLIKVHCRIQAPEDAGPLDWIGAYVRLPSQNHFPLGQERLAFCGSDRRRLAFHLPPGRYVLHAYNDSSEDESSFQAETFPDVVFHLSEDESDVDLGEVVLTVKPRLVELIEESKARGKWTDFTQRYDQPAPDWHVHDAKGVSKEVQPRDFRGKWLAIYFWGTSCTPCLKRGLPELIDFWEQHREQRGQFEIVAFCLDKDGGVQSIDDIDRLLKPVIENVWGGKSLEFPVLLDNSFATHERYGLRGVGHVVLVDPQGNLRKGDLTTLAELLSNPD